MDSWNVELDPREKWRAEFRKARQAGGESRWDIIGAIMDTALDQLADLQAAVSKPSTQSISVCLLRGEETVANINVQVVAVPALGEFVRLPAGYDQDSVHPLVTRVESHELDLRDPDRPSVIVYCRQVEESQ